MADETSASSLKTSTGGGLALENTAQKLEDVYQLAKWLRQVRMCIQDAGLLEYLEDTVARPQEPGLEQVEFDRRRAIVNNTIFDSLANSVQVEVAKCLKERLTTVSPRDIIHEVMSDLLWPKRYYRMLGEFASFPSQYEFEGREKGLLERLHEEWDLLKACEHGVSDEVYICVVLGLVEGTSHQKDFFDDIEGDMQSYDLTEGDIRAWLKARFNLPEL